MIVGLPVIDAIVEGCSAALGSDSLAYRHHAYRVVNLVDELAPIDQEDHLLIGVVAAFHEYSLWTEGETRNSAQCSAVAAVQWLRKMGLNDLQTKVRRMILSGSNRFPCIGADLLTDCLRRAILCDQNIGLRSFGISRRKYAEIVSLFPYHGFYGKRLAIILRSNVVRRWGKF